MHHLWRVETLYWMDIALPGADLWLLNFNPNHRNLSSPFCKIRESFPEHWKPRVWMMPNLSSQVILEVVITTSSNAANATKLASWQLSVFGIFLFQMPLTLSFVKSAAIWHVAEESSSCNEPNLPLRHQGSPKRPTYLIVLVLTSSLWRWVMKCYRKCTVFGCNTVVLKWIVCQGSR